MDNKTISNRVFLRLVAQANEADIRGDEIVATNITKQIEKYAQEGVRPDDAGYKYSKEELKEDIKDILWKAATRVFDYYNDTPDGKRVEEVVDFEADSFIEYIENMISKKIGPYEEPSPGQIDDEDDDAVSEESEEFKKFELEDDEDEDLDDDVVYDEEEDEEQDSRIS